MKNLSTLFTNAIVSAFQPFLFPNNRIECLRARQAGQDHPPAPPDMQ
jgi:hypothetical protein